MNGIAGYCPMGCGRTLFAGSDGHVTCSWAECPDPGAADSILGNSETERVVTIREDGFTVEHPLRERVLDGAPLHECRLHQDLSAAGGPPKKPGCYRVTRHEPDVVSESYRFSPTGAWNFEEIG